MSRRVRWTGRRLLAGVGMLAGALWLAAPEGLTPEGVAADLATRVPDGSARAEAEAWFATVGVPPTPLADARTGREVGLFALIPDRRWLSSDVIYAEVRVGGDGRVTGRRVERIKFSL